MNDMHSDMFVMQFVRFVFVGIIVAIVHFIILFLFVEYANLGPIYSSSLGFAVSAIVNYLLNYHYTFHSKASHHKAIVRFFIIALIGLVANAFLMKIWISMLSMYYIVAQIFSILCVMIWNFLANRKWTFVDRIELY